MSTEGWIFMVGFRVFDVGLLIAWLFWFFRLRDDGPDPPDDGGGGGSDSRGPRPRRGPGGGGLRLPTGRWPAGDWRRRDAHRPRRSRSERPGRPLPQPLPARVRFPGGEPARISPRR
jgi:hypothetical protein